jgi:hypothetical protein
MQVIEAIESAGGVLMLSGDRIRYDVPGEAAPLVEALREHKPEVVQVLRGRQEANQRHISRWMTYRCALPRNPAPYAIAHSRQYQ